MKRREFILAVGGAAAAWPLAARAQQERMRRIGILMAYPKGDPELTMRLQAFRQELAKLGWTEGINVQLDERWTGDDMDRVRSEAASLVKSNPDAYCCSSRARSRSSPQERAIRSAWAGRQV